MRLELTEEHDLIRRTVREFAEARVRPIARELDAEARFPEETVQEMGALGLLGLLVPETYGGNPVDTVSFAIAMEEMARVDGSHALILGAHSSLCTGHLLIAASEAQKERYLPKLASGEWMGAWALTEPMSGSDASTMRTRAVPDGDGWRLTGQKNFCTNAPHAGLIVVLAMTNPEAGSRGISAFAVEAGTEGLTIGREEDKLGVRASATSQVALEDCWVPADHLVGTENEGYRDALRVLDGGRIGIGAMALGLAQGALDEALAYSLDRRAFGSPIFDHQAVQFSLADMATRIQAARLLVYRAAWRKDQGKPFKKEAAMAKLFASETAMRVTTDAVQIHGGYGFIKDYPVERMFRDAKLTEIGEGTSEIQRMVIGREILEDG